MIVPAGILPSDVLASSPIIHGDDGGGGGGGGAAAGGGGDGGGNFAQYGGVNPDLDPELAMVGSCVFHACLNLLEIELCAGFTCVNGRRKGKTRKCTS